MVSKKMGFKEISNKHLAILIGFAIMLSIIGLFISPAPVITGGLIFNITNSTGTTSFAVKGNLVVTLTDAAINLGSLEFGENKSSENVSDWFEFRNDGSVDFDVYAYGAASPFSSTTNGANTLPTNYYQVHGYSTTSGLVNTTYRAVPNSLANKTLLFSGIVNTDGIDTGKVGIKVEIPIDEDAG